MFESVEKDNSIMEGISSFLVLAGIVAVCVGIIIAACYPYINPAAATHVLTINNYHNIQITGHRYLGCDSAFTKTAFRAVAPNGENVTGVVCGDMSGSQSIHVD
jgi:hypothetical protein